MFLVVATSAGATTCTLPDCHWARMNWPCGSPFSFHFSGPSTVCTVLECSHWESLAWSSEPTAVTAAWSTWAVPNASAASSAGTAPW